MGITSMIPHLNIHRKYYFLNYLFNFLIIFRCFNRTPKGCFSNTAKFPIAFEYNNFPNGGVRTYLKVCNVSINPKKCFLADDFQTTISGNGVFNVDLANLNISNGNYNFTIITNNFPLAADISIQVGNC